MDTTHALRILAVSLATIDLVLIVMFALYFKRLYELEPRGAYHKQFVAARLGTFTLLLAGMLAVALTMNGVAYLHDIAVIAIISRVVSVALLTAIFIIMLAWLLCTLESKFRGRWQRLDFFVECLLYGDWHKKNHNH